jgi:hypothetical protein
MGETRNAIARNGMGDARTAIAAAKRGLAAYMEKDKVYANLADIARMLEIASKLGRLATGLAPMASGAMATICRVARRGHGRAGKNLRRAVAGEIVDVQTVPVLPEKTA